MIPQNSTFYCDRFAGASFSSFLTISFITPIAVNFTVGENIEAIDQLGVWAVAKVIEKRDASVVVTFPPWKHEWDPEIVDPNEVRTKTQEDVLVPCRCSNKKVKII